MATNELAKQMADEEKVYSAEVARQITAALNSSATVKQADAIHGTSGGWPYTATKEMLSLYKKTADKAWGKMRSGYSHVGMSIEVHTSSGKNPSATATAEYQGEFRGGETYALAPGDTIASIAKSVYGYECYANDVWAANDRILGKKCRQLPAGFGINIPQIWVPKWKKDPKVSLAPGTTSKAVKILYPALEHESKFSKSAKRVIDLAAFILEITFQVEATIKVQKKGTVDASFKRGSYEVAMKKSLGPLEAGWTTDFKEGGFTGEISISNSKVKGLSMHKKITLKKGKLSITFGTVPVKYKFKGTECEGTVEVSAEIKLTPKPPRTSKVKKMLRSPVKVGMPKPVRMHWGWKVAIGAVVVGGAACIIASAGACVPFALKGGAIGLAGGLAAAT